TFELSWRALCKYSDHWPLPRALGCYHTRPSYRTAECGQQLPPFDGDCHTPLPCEVRKKKDTTARACCPNCVAHGVGMLPEAFPSLHCRRIGREFAELIGRVGAHRRRARIARARDGARELYHRLAIRHLQGQYNVVVSGRHIGAEQLSA